MVARSSDNGKKIKSIPNSYDESAEKHDAVEIKFEGEKSGLGCVNGIFKISEELTLRR